MNGYQCYEVLGVKNDAPFKEIKSAYRKLALEFHPDKNMSEKDGKKFRVITEAYQFLKTEHKRAVSTKTNFSSNNNWKYNQKNSNKEYTFNARKKNWWGAKPADKPPEADWEKYTRETESAYQDFWRYYEKTFWEYDERARGETTKVDEYEQLGEEKILEVFADVDRSLCIGCCSCETIAPSVFSVDKFARINPKSRVINQKGAPPGKILDAAQTCPTKAISVTEVDSKKRLYPW